jgi:hypothetical protein
VYRSDKKRWSHRSLNASPEGYVSLGENFYTLKDGNLYLKRLRDDTFNNSEFFGTQYGSEITLIFNESFPIVKTPSRIEIQSKSILDMEMTTEASLSYPSMKTRIKSGTFRIYEGHLIGDIKRDMLDQSYSNIVDQDIREATALLRGQVVVGDSFKTKLSGGKDFSIKSVILDFVQKMN